MDASNQDIQKCPWYSATYPDHANICARPWREHSIAYSSRFKDMERWRASNLPLTGVAEPRWSVLFHNVKRMATCLQICISIYIWSISYGQNTYLNWYSNYRNVLSDFTKGTLLAVLFPPPREKVFRLKGSKLVAGRFFNQISRTLDPLPQAAQGWTLILSSICIFLNKRIWSTSLSPASENSPL